MANTSTGEIVRDINSVPEERRKDFTEIPEGEFQRAANEALEGKDQTTIDREGDSDLARWMRVEEAKKIIREGGTQEVAEVAIEASIKAIEDTTTRTYHLSAKNELELNKRFSYHTPRPDQLPRYEQIRAIARMLALVIWRYTPPSREQALALTKLEEAVMHANSAIAREPEVLAQGIPAEDKNRPKSTEDRDRELQALADENAVGTSRR